MSESPAVPADPSALTTAATPLISTEASTTAAPSATASALKSAVARTSAASEADLSSPLGVPRSSTPRSHAVSFDKNVLNLLKLDTHDLEIRDDVLLVIDKDRRKKSRRTCDFGTKSPNSYTTVIPLYNVLWAEVAADGRRLVIDFAAPASKTRLRATSVTIPFDPAAADRPTADDVASWAELLRSQAYGPAPQRRRAYVLVNPHAGPGGAVRSWEADVRPLFEAARVQLTVETTRYSGQAVDLVRELDIDSFDTVVACSGDGLPHEVFNGLGRRPDARRALATVAVAHIPCGSGNAMACNLYGTHRPSQAALAIVKGVVAPLDLVSITHQSNGGDAGGNAPQRILSFLSQAVGVIAEADLATEHLRWMGGARFTWGFLERLLSRRVYPCELAVKIAIDDKHAVKAHYSAHSRRQQDAGLRAEHERAKLGSTSSSDGGRENEDGKDEDDAGGKSSPEDSEASGSSASVAVGLPPLQYGTVADSLPDDWTRVPGEKLGNLYCGTMAYMAPDANFFSAALMDDGLMDLVTIRGDIPPTKSLSMMLSVENGHFFDNPNVDYRKIVAYRIVPKQQKDGYISIDGERIPFGPFQAEIHQGLGRVVCKRGVYEAPGPMNWEKVTPTERFMA